MELLHLTKIKENHHLLGRSCTGDTEMSPFISYSSYTHGCRDSGRKNTLRSFKHKRSLTSAFFLVTINWPHHQSVRDSEAIITEHKTRATARKRRRVEELARAPRESSLPLSSWSRRRKGYSAWITSNLWREQQPERLDLSINFVFSGQTRFLCARIRLLINRCS